MKTSDAGIALIKRHEALRLKAYICPAGYKTIGYGHVVLPGEKLEAITAEEAEQLLRRDLKIAEDCINQSIDAEMTQTEFDALVSLAFNIGVNAFRKSTLLKLIKNEKYKI